MNRNVIITIATVIGVLLLVIVVWLTYRNAQLGTLDISVTPSDARIKVNADQTEIPGMIRLEPGRYTLEITRDGFQTQTITVEIKKGQTITKNVRLLAINAAEAARWQAEHPHEARAAEAEAGKEVVEQGAKITAENPILNRLPYVTSTFRIDFGVSERYPNDPEAIGIYITIDSEAGKNDALRWMRSQGFDPNKLEIIYRSSGSTETGE